METSADVWRGAGLPPVTLLALTIALFWVQLVGHEAAHYAALAVIKQFYPPLAFERRWPLSAQIAFFAGGPVFTVVLVGLSAAVAARIRNARAIIVTTALGWCAVTRIVFIGPGTLVGAASDERAIAALLGVPLPVLGLSEMLLAAIAVMTFLRAIPTAARRSTFTAIGTGAVLGLLSAWALGPLLGLPVGGLSSQGDR